MKKILMLTALGLTACLFPANTFGQHSDIEFGYDDLNTPTRIVIEQDETTLDGLQFFEADFDVVGGDFFTDDPGFVTEALEGLLVNSGDQIWINFLNADKNLSNPNSAFGVGFVNYYNPSTDMLEASGRLSITDNGGMSTTNLILAGAAVESGDNPQLLGTGDMDGDIHDHVTFDLLDDGSAPDGAYGILMQLQADFDTPDGNMDINSDPFWVIFNKGMSEADFEANALPAFGVQAVPEPSSGLLFLIGVGCFVARRRRRLQA